MPSPATLMSDRRCVQLTAEPPRSFDKTLTSPCFVAARYSLALSRANTRCIALTFVTYVRTSWSPQR